MPYATYLADQMGTAALSPSGPLVAGSHAELILTYTAGPFGIDDSGMLKIAWRTTSDMGKPQLAAPKLANFTTVEASNGAVLECRVDRVNIRPWSNVLVIRVGRGFLRAGDTITVRLGDRRQGSPGLRLQTNVEETFELKVLVDAFATYEFTELTPSPEVRLVAGPPARWRAVIPSTIVAGAPFRLSMVAEDLWGNPTTLGGDAVALQSSRPVAGLPAEIARARGEGPVSVEGLVCREPGPLQISGRDSGLGGRDIAFASNPAEVVGVAPRYRRFWGDLHGQSEETVGTNSIDDYFRFARDQAFLDMTAHQGNDFQMTDAFWDRLNRLTAAYNEPGRFLAIPGYEWSGNTGMGGDRNVLYRREGRPIRRSSEVLIAGTAPQNATQFSARALFQALVGEDAVVIAHVGGRYADVALAHDGRLETAVEVHSTWGTFEWILNDALSKGYRVGVVAHSDDHKGRPGATRPGASTFGAIGGLTCYLMPELTRDALFEALRARRHYATTGARILLDVQGRFQAPVRVFDRDPAHGPAEPRLSDAVTMGAIVAAGDRPMTLSVSATGTAPIERIDVLHGPRLVETVKSYGASELAASRRVRVQWEGAEYRGRGRETHWKGRLSLEGTGLASASPVNFLNPERPFAVDPAQGVASFESVTTGNLAAIDLSLTDAWRGTLRIETSIVSGVVELAKLAAGEVVLEGGGLGRRVRVWRLPEAPLPASLSLEHIARPDATADVPVLVRITQLDGHQAWSSPIYLIPP